MARGGLGATVATLTAYVRALTVKGRGQINQSPAYLKTKELSR